MKKALILVEGQTEEAFVKQVLAPHLWAYEISPEPKIITTKRVKRGSDFKGGIPTFPKVEKQIRLLLNDSSAVLVTTMIDYYGLPNDFPGQDLNIGGTNRQRIEALERALEDRIHHLKFKAYFSLHEFEAMLFSSPDAIASLFKQPQSEIALQKIKASFPTPEDIDDHPETAPSKRIKKIYQNYIKPIHGIITAKKIGLSKIREECPHFNAWLEILENPAKK